MFLYAAPPTALYAETTPHPVPVGIGVTTGTGFRVIPDPSVDLTRFLNESGVVDFEVVAGNRDYIGMLSFSRRLEGNGKIIEPRSPGPHMGATAGGTLKTVANPDAVNLNVSQKLLKDSVGASATAQSSDCQVDWGYRPQTQIGSGFHRVRGVRLVLTYKTGSTSTLGVGLRLDGGNWGVGGSAVRTNGSLTGIQWDTSRRQDQFHFTQYQYKIVRCGWIWMNGWGYWRSEKASPHHLLGGNASRRATWYPKTPTEYCQRYRPAGAGFELSVVRSKAVTYRRGVKLPLINLSSQSGFNEETGLHADVRRRRFICGWTGPSATNPGTLVVGLPR